MVPGVPADPAGPAGPGVLIVPDSTKPAIANATSRLAILIANVEETLDIVSTVSVLRLYLHHAHTL